MTGKASQQAGDKFEKAIIAACEHYEKTGQLAWWSHPGPKMSFYGKKKGRARAVGVAPPDFLFVLGQYYYGAEIGQFGMIEAKATKNKERLTLAKRMHQFDQMRQTRARIGFGLYGYLIDWYAVGEVRFYPVREVQVVSEKPLKVNLVRWRGIVVPDLSMGGEFVSDWLAMLP